MKNMRFLTLLLVCLVFGASAQAQITFAPPVNVGAPGGGPINCVGQFGFRMDNGGAGNIQHATALWSNNTTINLNQAFQATFNIRFGNVGSADGITFTMHQDPAGLNAIAGGGGWLGVSNNWGAGIAPSVNVEFDIFNNGVGVNDLAGDHAAISYNGNISAPVTAPVGVGLVNNVWHQVVVNWQPCTQTLTVNLDGNQILTRTDDLINNVFGGNANNILFGFTSATWSNNTTHDVCFINLVQTPVNCCAEVIQSTQQNCNDFTFSLTSNNVNQNCWVWSVDGTVVGNGPTIMTTLPTGQHVICVNYLGTQIANPNNVCCEQVCDTVVVPPMVSDTCREEVTINCGDNVDLDQVSVNCESCDTLSDAQTGDWINIATGLPVPDPSNITTAGIYYQITTDPTGCIQCVKIIEVKTLKQVLSVPVDISPNCPCTTMTSAQLDALLAGCHPSVCPGGETEFRVLEFDAGGNFISSFIVDPGNPGLFCAGNNYIVRPTDETSCCEVHLFIYCSGFKGGQPPFTDPFVTNVDNDPLFEQYFDGGTKSFRTSGEPKATQLMQVMPNPAREQFNIRIYSETGPFERVIIHNQQGQEMESVTLPAEKGETTLNFQTANWPSGVYVASLYYEGRIVEVRKITVTK